MGRGEGRGGRAAIAWAVRWSPRFVVGRGHIGPKLSFVGELGSTPKDRQTATGGALSAPLLPSPSPLPRPFPSSHLEVSAPLLVGQELAVGLHLQDVLRADLGAVLVHERKA